MSNNTKLGVGALQNNSGSDNTGLGAYTSHKNTTPSNNTAIGSNSSFFNTTGSNNTSVGAGSMCNNSTGSLNTAIGSSALQGISGNSVGNQNTAIGVQSLYNNLGDENTAVGSYTALGVTGGSYNTFLGAKTTFSNLDETHHYSTAIGYGAKIEGSNQIVMGGTGAGTYPNVIIKGAAFLPNFDFYNTTDNQIVPKEYVDVISQGLVPKAPCKCVATDGVTIGPTGIYIDSPYNNLYTIDGYPTSLGDRVLINNQGPTGPTGTAPGIGNGIYVVSGPTGGPYEWIRSDDMQDGSSALGAYTFIENGDTYNGSAWVQNVTDASGADIVVGTNPISFVKSGGFPFRVGRGLNTSVENSKIYLNVDTSLNFVNYLDSTPNILYPGGTTGGSGILNIGNNTTQVIIGPTGETRNPVQFTSGITGPTGSFETVKIGSGPDMGVTGTVLDVSGGAIITKSIYNEDPKAFECVLTVASEYIEKNPGVVSSGIATLSQGNAFGYIGTRGTTLDATTNGKNFIGIYPDAIGDNNYNPITQQNDHLIVVGRYGLMEKDVSGGFVICPWSGTESGTRMDPQGNFTFYNTIKAPKGITGATGSFEHLIVNENAIISGTLNVENNFTVNTDKFSVDASNGNTTVNGILTVAKPTNSNIILNTNTNDRAFINWYSTGDQKSYLQISTGDNASLSSNWGEPIYFTQVQYVAEDTYDTYSRMKINGKGCYINLDPSADTQGVNFLNVPTSNYELNVNANAIIAGTLDVSGNTEINNQLMVYNTSSPNSYKGAFLNSDTPSSIGEGVLLSANGSVTEMKLNNSGSRHFTINNNGSFNIVDTSNNSAPFTAGNNLLSIQSNGNTTIYGDLNVSGNLDMSNNDILNVNNVNLSTINGEVYPPTAITPDLATVLAEGNSAGTKNIDMSNNDILKVHEIKYNKNIILNQHSYTDGSNNIAIGYNAQLNNPRENSVALGREAGKTNQGFANISAGYRAHYQRTSNENSNYSIAIGFEAGYKDSYADTIAIGRLAGYNSQGANSIAIGNQAGAGYLVADEKDYDPQGQNSIAIGNQAGLKTCHKCSIILNATGVEFNTDTSDAFYVKPIREDTNNTYALLNYNTSNGEVVRSNVSINDIQSDITDLSNNVASIDLSYVLSNENSAGANDINMNNNDILNVANLYAENIDASNVNLTTINGEVYPPITVTPDLATVLAEGNSAGSNDIDMNNNNILNANDINANNIKTKTIDIIDESLQANLSLDTNGNLVVDNQDRNVIIKDGRLIVNTNAPYTATLFVSKEGNDTTGTGSESNPYATIQAAINKGNSLTNERFQVIIDNGTYTEDISIFQECTLQGTTNVDARSAGQANFAPNINGLITISSDTKLMITGLVIRGGVQCSTSGAEFFAINCKFIINDTKGNTPLINMTNNIDSYISNCFFSSYYNGSWINMQCVPINVNRCPYFVDNYITCRATDYSIMYIRRCVNFSYNYFFNPQSGDTLNKEIVNMNFDNYNHWVIFNNLFNYAANSATLLNTFAFFAIDPNSTSTSVLYFYDNKFLATSGNPIEYGIINNRCPDDDNHTTVMFAYDNQVSQRLPAYFTGTGPFAYNYKVRDINDLYLGGNSIYEVNALNATEINLSGDLDMGNNNILNVANLYAENIDASNVNLSTINGAVYPPITTNPDLATVLATGNSAGTYNIDMSNNDILKVHEIKYNKNIILNQHSYTDGSNNIAIGYNAQLNNPRENSVALGREAGKTNQGFANISAGYRAHYQRTSNENSNYSIAIGFEAGYNESYANTIAIGMSAGYDSQGANSIAIGMSAGYDSQGANSIAIGNQAGLNTCHTRSIILNATGVEFNTDTSDAFYVKPIREDTNNTYALLNYNTGNGEVVRSNVSINDIQSDITDLSNNVASIDLSYVLSNGNSAGANDLNMNNNDILNIANIDVSNVNLSTINGEVYPPATVTPDLATVLEEGNSAGANDLNMNNNDILNVNNINLSTINGAVYPPTTINPDLATVLATGNSAGTYDVDMNNNDITNTNELIFVNSVKINQSIDSSFNISIGYNAGMTGQNYNSVAIGYLSGSIDQSYNSVAVGYNCGNSNQGYNSVAIGSGCATTNQGAGGVAIGVNSGITNQGGTAIAIGGSAARENQGENSIALGTSAGRIRQGTNCIAIGNSAGYTDQSYNSIAIGYLSGANQSNNSIALGYGAANQTQGDGSVCIGANSNVAGNQGRLAVSLGYDSARNGQGDFSLALGNQAGSNTCHTGSIILNATNASLNSTQSNSTFIKPIRASDASGNGVLAYSQTTGEVVHSTQPLVSKVRFNGNVLIEGTGGTYNNSIRDLGSYVTSSTFRPLYLDTANNEIMYSKVPNTAMITIKYSGTNYYSNHNYGMLLSPSFNSFVTQSGEGQIEVYANIPESVTNINVVATGCRSNASSGNHISICCPQKLDTYVSGIYYGKVIQLLVYNSFGDLIDLTNTGTIDVQIRWID